MRSENELSHTNWATAIRLSSKSDAPSLPHSLSFADAHALQVHSRKRKFWGMSCEMLLLSLCVCECLSVYVLFWDSNSRPVSAHINQ